MRSVRRSWSRPIPRPSPRLAPERRGLPAVSGLAALDQPTCCARAPEAEGTMACSVSTVFGPCTPGGRDPRYLDDRVVQVAVGPAVEVAGSPSGTGWPHQVIIEARGPRQAGEHGQDVGPPVHLRRRDPEGTQQLGSGRVEVLARKSGRFASLLQAGRRRLEGDDVGGADAGTDGVRRPGLGPELADRGPVRPDVGPDGDLVRGQVGPGRVEDVAVAGGGGRHDDDGDHHTEADGGEGRARTGPKAGEVPQRQADRDRGAPARGGRTPSGRKARGGSRPGRGRLSPARARAFLRCPGRGRCCPRSRAIRRR